MGVVPVVNVDESRKAADLVETSSSLVWVMQLYCKRCNIPILPPQRNLVVILMVVVVVLLKVRVTLWRLVVVGGCD